MFNLGISEIILISVIALIFIGPKQLPEIARALGKALNELKRASEDLTSSFTNPKNYSQTIDSKDEAHNHGEQGHHENQEISQQDSNSNSNDNKKVDS